VPNLNEVFPDRHYVTWILVGLDIALIRDFRVDVGCESLISICFSKIAGAPVGSPQFLGSKEESMACSLRRYEVMDSGI
jgi:hypothetical protein